MHDGNLIIAVLAVMPAASCTHHVPEPVGVAPSTPHISWAFMSGDRDTPDRDYVCQSDPRDDLTMPASGPDNPVFADLHFYYQGAAAETKYTGTVEIGVFQVGSNAPEPSGVISRSRLRSRACLRTRLDEVSRPLGRGSKRGAPDVKKRKDG